MINKINNLKQEIEALSASSEAEVEEVLKDVCMHQLEQLGVMFYNHGYQRDAQYIKQVYGYEAQWDKPQFAQPFSACDQHDDQPNEGLFQCCATPHDAYARTALEAQNVVWQLMNGIAHEVYDPIDSISDMCG